MEDNSNIPNPYSNIGPMAPTPPTPPHVKEINPKFNFLKSKWLKIGISLIIIFTLLSIGFILGKNSSNKTQIAQTPKQILPSTIPTPTSKIDIQNWIEYSYKTWSLKHPKDWEVILNTEIAGNTNDFDLRIQSVNAKGYQPDEISITTFNANQGLKNDYRLNPSKKFVLTKNGDDYIKFNINGTTIYASCAFYSEQQKTLDLCNKIISTFKFTDSTSQSITSDWNTYKNSQYSFSLKYPKDWKTTSVYDQNSSPSSQSSIGFIPSNKDRGSNSPPIYLLIYNNLDNLSIQDWDKEVNGTTPRGHLLYLSTTKQINLPDLTAYVNDNGDCEPVTCKEIIIMGNKKVIILRDPDFTGMGYTKEEVKNYQQIFDLILSTFKFIQ